MDLIHPTMQQPFTRSRKSSPLVSICFIVRSARADTPNQCVPYGQTFLITTPWTDIPHHYVMDGHSSSLRHGQTFLMDRHSSSLFMDRHSSSLRHEQTFLITTAWTGTHQQYASCGQRVNVRTSCMKKNKKKHSSVRHA